MNDKETMNNWIEIISKMYTNLHNTERVLHSSSVSDKKIDRLIKYFNRLEEIHKRVSESKYKSDEKLLKSFYYDLYVIKPEDIPESYFQNQVRLARERGYGNLEISPNIRKQMIDEVIEDQKRTLDKWIEYFLYDEESKAYEMWEKYWVFQGLQSLGKYDKEKGNFSKRDKHTVYPFPPVEREYIFTTLKLMEDYIKDKKGDEEIKSALGSGNFKLLYEYVIKQSFLKGEHQSNTTLGKWVKYNQGSDYNILRDSLQGYYTGWCTAAGENFAKKQLAGGDFYVYYTLDEKGEAKVPRIAIRMDGKNKIGEIRGIAKDQNLEPEMMPVLDEKLKEFPDRDKYLKKEHDMKLLTLIDKKVNSNIELSIEELRFLYEIDGNIEGFGYRKDPRIDEIKHKRNQKKDYTIIFNISEDEVALSKEEWKEAPHKIEVFAGDLDLRELTSAKELTLPQSIIGSLNLSGLRSSEGLTLPQSIRDSLSLSRLTSAEGLTLPQNIGGSLLLNSLISAEGLTLPQSIGDSLNLRGLRSVEGLTLPQSVGENLYLDNLISAEGLTLPQSIGGTLNLISLRSFKGLTLPQSVGGYLHLSSLTSAEGLILPQSVGKGLYLDNLISAEGLILPQSIGGSLNLSGLRSAEGLTLPQSVGENLYLDNLTSAEGLILPYGFDLNMLSCNTYIKQKIINNPYKYYMTQSENNKKGK